MFKSKTRRIVFPQYEHDHLAGALAVNWGNDLFDRPALDFNAFVQGVLLHDWQYKLLDNLPIIEAPEADWMAVTREGVYHRFANPVTDIVVKLHIKRLLSFDESPERSEMKEEIEKRVAARLPESGFTRAEFEWADRITRFCDQVAFDFCFEQPVQRSLPICPRVDSPETVEVTYAICENGAIEVAPWPFTIPSLAGVIIGYQIDGYPEELTPQGTSYIVQPR
ncbi:MAG: DUF3891 family protein [Caldilineaceae bacterium]